MLNGRATTGAFLAAVFVLAGCQLPDLDLTGRPCPCVEGWVCDNARDVCVRAGADGDGDVDAVTVEDTDVRNDGDPSDLELDADSPWVEPLPCDWSGAFSFDVVAPMLELNSPEDERHLSYADFTARRQMYFSRASALTGDWDVHVAVGVGEDGFESPVPFASPYLDTVEFEGRYAPSTEGSYELVSAVRASQGVGGVDIFLQAFADGGILLVAELSSPDDDNDPTLTADGSTVYLARSPLGYPAESDILRSRRGPADTAFPSPLPIPVVNSPSAELHPTLAEREAVLVFASDRPGGSGGYDLWYSLRLGSTFSEPLPVPGLVNTAEDELDPEVSSDGCGLFFVARRGSVGDTDIYRAFHRLRP